MNFIFICGLGGDKGMTYVPNLKKFLEDNGHRFYAPHMPSFEDGITYDKYKESFEELIINEKLTDSSDIVIIAQSAGTNFMVKYFANNPINICGYISCAGFYSMVDKNPSKETLE